MAARTRQNAVQGSAKIWRGKESSAEACSEKQCFAGSARVARAGNEVKGEMCKERARVLFYEAAAGMRRAGACCVYEAQRNGRTKVLKPGSGRW